MKLRQPPYKPKPFRKTIDYWLSMLPEPVFWEAKRNLRLQLRASPNDLAKDLPDALEQAFLWDKTQEGHRYWEVIHKLTKHKALKLHL